MKFAKDKEKTVEAIGPVGVAAAGAAAAAAGASGAAKTSKRHVLYLPTSEGLVKIYLSEDSSKKLKRDKITKHLAILEKKLTIPRLLVPPDAYKRGVVISLPEGKKALLKCANKQNTTTEAPKPEEPSASESSPQSSEESKPEEKPEEANSRENVHKEANSTKQENGKNKVKTMLASDLAKFLSLDSLESVLKGIKSAKAHENNLKTESSSAKSKSFSGHGSTGDNEFELKVPSEGLKEIYHEKKVTTPSIGENDIEKDTKDNSVEDAETKMQSSALESALNPSVVEEQVPNNEAKSFNLGFAAAAKMQKELGGEPVHHNLDGQLTKQFLSLFNRDMMVSLYKLAVKDLMKEFGIGKSNAEKLEKIAGKIRGLKEGRKELEHQYPGISRSLVSYNKYLPAIEGYLSAFNRRGYIDNNEAVNYYDDLPYNSATVKRSKKGSVTKQFEKMSKLIQPATERSLLDAEKEAEVDDEAGYDDCVDNACARKKEFLRNAHEYIRNLDKVAMQPYTKFDDESDYMNSGLMRGKGVTELRRRVKYSRREEAKADEGETENAIARQSLFKALTDASGKRL